MNDPRYIPPSDRKEERSGCGSPCYGGSESFRGMYNDLVDHAVFMDERDARQRDLIRRLADELAYLRGVNGCDLADDECATCNLLVEARGVEATNE